MNVRSASRVLPVALGFTLLVPALLPAEMNPGVTVATAAAAASAMLIMAFVRGLRSLSRETTLAIGAVTLLAAWLTVRSLMSLNPAVSFMGSVAQHAGSALWWVIAAWLLAAAHLADRRALRHLVAVGAVSGALFGAWGVLEALTVGDRAWGSAAGPFENSSSLGTYLAVAALAALAWGLASRRTGIRAAAGLSGGLCVAGTLASDSRAGLVGLVAGLAIAVFLRFAPTGRPVRWGAAYGLPIVALLAAALLVTAATSTLGTYALSAVQALGTARDAIWRSAGLQIAQAPILGSGPEQFSAWISWSFVDGFASVNGTYDPHNAIAALVLGGGVVAVMLWFVFASSTLAATTGTLHRAGRPLAVAAIVGVPCALVGASLFTWLTPAAAVLAAAVTGALLPDGGADREVEPASAADGVRRGAGRAVFALPAGLALLACSAALVLSVPMLAAEREFVTDRTTLDAAAFARLYERWPDPTYAALTIDAVLTRGGDPALGQRTGAAARQQALWHVDLALRQVYLAQLPLRDEPRAWAGFTAAIECGAPADPASGLWYTLAAAQADALGLTEEAATWAEKALQLDPGPDERALLEGIAAN